MKTIERYFFTNPARLFVYLSFIFFSLTISSCVDEIDLELDESEHSYLVFEGMIRSDSSVQVFHLSYSASFDAEISALPVHNAEVMVHFNDTSFHFEERQPGLYTAPFTGTSGTTYELIIDDGEKSYSAFATMGQTMTIDSLSFERFPMAGPDFHLIKFFAQDPAEEGQFYMLKPVKNEQVQDSLFFWGIHSDLFSNGLYLKDEVGTVVRLQETGMVKLQCYSISREYASFINQCSQAVDQNPFISTPGANVKGNISNGALGYFLASDVSTSDGYNLVMQ